MAFGGASSLGEKPFGGECGKLFTASHLSHLSLLFGYLRNEAGETRLTAQRHERMLCAALRAAVAKNDTANALILVWVGVPFEGCLNLAIERGHNETACALLESGAAPDGYSDFVDCTPLYVAAKEGNTEMVDKLLEKGADIDFFVDDGTDCMEKQEGTALFAATEHGQVLAVRCLMNAGADWSIRSVMGQSPLNRASELGDETVLRTLLELGVDVHETHSSGGLTALHVASDKTAVDLLVDAGADVEARSEGGLTPLMHALGEFLAPEAARALIHRGAAVNSQDEGGNSPLHYAVDLLSAEGAEAFGHLVLHLVDLLLRSGADERMANNNGETPADRAGALEGNFPRVIFDSLYKLLDNAHLDRVWRRRSLLVLCIARHHDRLLNAEIHTQETERASPDDSTVERADDDWTLAANWLLALRLEQIDVFRTIVGYL